MGLRDSARSRNRATSHDKERAKDWNSKSGVQMRGVQMKRWDPSRDDQRVAEGIFLLVMTLFISIWLAGVIYAIGGR